MAENIFHLVLARPEGAGPGTKGLSMFLVPKYLVNADGTLGERNGVEGHQRRAQDGAKGLHDLRADVRRRSGPAGGRHAGRRRARRHQADVHDHRERADDGRQQGDRDPVHRVPQRARLRQDPGAGRRPHPADRQDLAAGDDHPPPGRAPDADAAEGVRGGHAGARALHGHAAGRRAGRRGGRAAATRPRPRATTCSCRWSRASGSERAYEMLDAVPADPRRLRASCRTIRSSSTSGTRRSTASTRAPRASRAWTSSSARWSATRARRPSRCSPRSAAFATAGDEGSDGNGRLKTERAALADGVAAVEAMLAAMTGFVFGSLERPPRYTRSG